MHTHDNTLAEPAAPSPVARIAAIEGLRAWLAWAVVGYHLLNVTNIDSYFGLTARTDMIGQGAVHLFMMISGFVIAGLIVQRSEDWTTYIVRRAFRLFPAYWIALAIGGVAMYLEIAVFSHVSWAHDPHYAEDITFHAGNLAAIDAQPASQILTHVALLQGVAPPALVPNDTMSILGPAWSLTVEWQFYLAAPLLVWMLRRQGWALAAILAAFLGIVIHQKGWLAGWISTASLVQYLYLFVIGILTNLALPQVAGKLTSTWTVAFAVVALALPMGILPAIGLWLAFVLLVVRPPATGFIGRQLDHAFHLAFESPVAAWLGARSYAVYVLHSPIISIVAYLILPLHPFSRIEALIVLAAVVTPVTLVAADLMHRYVEQPMITLGGRVAARLRLAAQHRSEAKAAAPKIATQKIA